MRHLVLRIFAVTTVANVVSAIAIQRDQRSIHRRHFVSFIFPCSSFFLFFSFLLLVYSVVDGVVVGVIVDVGTAALTALTRATKATGNQLTLKMYFPEEEISLKMKYRRVQVDLVVLET